MKKINFSKKILLIILMINIKKIMKKRINSIQKMKKFQKMKIKKKIKIQINSIQIKQLIRKKIKKMKMILKKIIITIF